MSFDSYAPSMKSKSMSDMFGIDRVAGARPIDRKRLGRWPENHAGDPLPRPSAWAGQI